MSTQYQTVGHWWHQMAAPSPQIPAGWTHCGNQCSQTWPGRQSYRRLCDVTDVKRYHPYHDYRQQSLKQYFFGKFTLTVSLTTPLPQGRSPMRRYSGSLINDAKTAKVNRIEAAAAVVVSGTFAGPITRFRSFRAKAGSRGNKEFPADLAFAAMAANVLTLAAGRHAAATATTTARSPSSLLYTRTTATTATTTTTLPPPPPPPPPHQGVFPASAAFARRPDP